jgi:hypothetical protein
MTGFLKDNWKALLAVIAIGLLPFALPADSEGSFLFSPGKALFASDQLGAPAWRFYFEYLRHLHVPFWQPHSLGGMPTFDAGFGDSAYPLFILIGMLMPIKTFISWCFVAHVIIAGLTAFFLVRRFFGLDRVLATALAAAYMLNTNFVSHIHAGHTGKFYIMAWLPLALYFLLRSLRRDARWHHAVGLGLSIALIMSTFHPQFAYFVLMGFFLAWAWRTFLLVKEKRFPAAAATAVRFWGPILLGIGMVFFIFYPPTQWTKQYGVRGSGEKTTYEHATSWSMHPEEAASLIVPEFTGLNEKYWGRNPFKLNSEYPGLSVWFLGILGLVLFRREKGRWFWLWGSVGLLSILFGLGAHTPLFRLFYAFIPGIKNFRAPSMMLFWLATALLVMSADTLYRLTRSDKPIPAERRRGWSKRLLQVGLGLAGVLVLAGIAPGVFFGIWDALFSPDAQSNLANRAAAQGSFALGAIRVGVLLGLLVVATRKWLLDEVAPLRFGLALLAVTAVDLLWVDAKFIRTYDPDRYLAAQPATEFLKADTSQARVFGLPGTYDLPAMHYHEVYTADGWTDNEYVVYRNYRGKDYQQNPHFMAGLKQNADGSVSGSPFLDMLNVKYLAYKLPSDGALRLAPNTSVLGRAWFVTAWDTLPDTLALERMKEPGFDPRKLAYLSGSGLAPKAASEDNAAFTAPPPATAPMDSAQAAGDSARAAAPAAAAPAAPTASMRLTEHGYNRASWTIDAPSAGLAVFSELWFPHWQVKVDGKPAPLLRADYAFRGVMLEPGSHTVEFAYHSPWIALGLKVAALSAALLALLAFGLKALAPKLEGL